MTNFILLKFLSIVPFFPPDIKTMLQWVWSPMSSLSTDFKLEMMSYIAFDHSRIHGDDLRAEFSACW